MPAARDILFPIQLAMSHQPAAAVTVMVIDCWEVTAVLVGASNLNHKDRVAAAATYRPVWPPAKIVAELVWSVVVRS